MRSSSTGLSCFAHLVLLTCMCESGDITLAAWALLALIDAVALCVLAYLGENGRD